MNKYQIAIKFPPLVMWLVCACFYGYQYFLQVSPSVMANDLMRDFSVNATALGNLAACYFYTYAAMQIPVGVLLDRFGARTLLTVAAAVCAFGCLLFGGTHIFAITILGRLCIGLGASFAVVGCMYIAAKRLPLKHFAFLTGIVITIGMLGAIGGQTPLALLVNKIDWRNTMLLFGAIGFAIAFCLWVVIGDSHQQSKIKQEAVIGKASILMGLKHVVCSKQAWLIAIYGGLMFMPISVFGSLWGVPFLMRKYSLPNTSAGAMITMLFLGMAIGTPFFGWLSDYIGRRKPVMFLGGVGALLSILVVLYVPGLSHAIAAFLLLVFGFFSGGFLVSFAVIREIDVTNSPGASTGFMNMLNMIGGAFAQPLVGWFLDLNGHGVMEGGVHYYSLGNYEFALSILPICIFVSLLTLPWIKETYCRNVL